MIVWPVILAALLIAGSIFLCKKRFISSIFCFIPVLMVSFFIPGAYTILLYNGMTEITTTQFSNFEWVCSLLTWLGGAGLLMNVLVTLLTMHKKYSDQEKAELNKQLQELNQKLDDITVHLNKDT